MLSVLGSRCDSAVATCPWLWAAKSLKMHEPILPAPAGSVNRMQGGYLCPSPSSGNEQGRPSCVGVKDPHTWVSATLDDVGKDPRRRRLPTVNDVGSLRR